MDIRPSVVGQQNYANNKPKFGARINLKSTGIKEYTEYLDRCKNAPKGWFSSNKNIKLFNKVQRAFEQHPSKEVIDMDVHYRHGELFNARGTAKTSKGKVVDIEPSRSDDGTAPMENLFRKLLDPDNKKVLNRLLGKEHANEYDNWWNKSVKPIWNDVKKIYKVDDTIIDGGKTAKDYSKEFRNANNTSLKERIQEAWKVLKGE